MKESIARLESNRIVLPGIASAHSHAFQRGLRGHAQRSVSRGSFWSWRDIMYRFAERLDPDGLYALSRYAFAELARNGVCAVGEFHYLHHQLGGVPYEDRTLLADTVIRAARETGLRINLLRVFYERAGANRPPEGAQYRFSDQDVDDAFGDIETLIKRWKHDPFVKIGIAPHSIRAVRAECLSEIAQFAQEHSLMLHMHVAEQKREIQECLAEHGLRPVELLCEKEVINERFVAVHATHLQSHEIRLLGRSPSFVCVCRTTERDLGDGSPNLRRLQEAGTRFCVGVDSHAQSDPFLELRALELDERVRTQKRTIFAQGTDLLHIGSQSGYAAIGFPGAEKEDRIELSLDDIALATIRSETLDDTIAFAGSGRAVCNVYVDKTQVLESGAISNMQKITDDFKKVVIPILKERL